MDVLILNSCSKEIEDFPEVIKVDLFEAINDLKSGLTLSMPLSRRMEGMGPGVFELRLKDRSGIYRVIYFFKKGDAIYLVHGFQKKTNKTPQKNIDVALMRIKRLL